MFAHRQTRSGIGLAVTDRHGGVSRPPYAQLNLADHVGDDPAAVSQNRARVSSALTSDGLPPDVLVTMRQVHGTDVAVVDAPPPRPPEADALVTAVTGLVLVVLVADCTPLLLWDEEARVVAAAHVGRRGLASGVVPATLEAMCGLGAAPERLHAFVGPGICADHYEVPAEMRAEVEVAAPGSAAVAASGAPALDIRAGLIGQLERAGVSDRSCLPACTAEEAALFSYRRDSTTGRFAGLIWLEP